MTRVLVVGFGATGRATAAAAHAQGWSVVVVDDASTEGAAAAAGRLGVELLVAPGPVQLEALVAGADVVVPSPGVPVGHGVHEVAARLGVEVVSEIELAARFLAAGPPPRPALVAVTGTNGKTTVTTQVQAALKASGLAAVAAGNIGLPLVEAVLAAPAPDVVVAEVSSFQLQHTTTFHPAVSCWLNLAADHLDWHPSAAHYRAAKARIWANQGAGDTVVVNADDPEVMAEAAVRPAGSALVTFSTVGAADWAERDGVLLAPGDEPLLDADELPRSLPHDRANALAAAAVASASGASLDGIRSALRTTGPGPHRVELVGDAGGAAWYDDSKATTPASVLAAVAGFASVVLVAGGRNKGLDLGALAATVPPVHAVVAIGEATADLVAVFAGIVPVTRAASMPDAVAAAHRLSLPGDAVVLSPGCSSFDWYRSYAERGDAFAALVHQLMEKESNRC